MLAHAKARAGLARMADPGPGDTFAYNVFSGSRQLLEQIRQLQRDYFRELRALVGESREAPEVVAVVNLQLFTYDPEGEPST